jgi:hypothetical protein
VPFFATFLLISSWLLVNLWIAVILDNFDEAQSMEDQTSFTRTDIAFFAKHWAKFDPKGTLRARDRGHCDFALPIQGTLPAICYLLSPLSAEMFPLL